MKTLSTLLILFFFSVISIAQITIDPEVVMLETDGTEVELKFRISNTGTEAMDVYWMFERGEGFPAFWDIIICDARLCYQENIFKSSNNLPNVMQPDSSFDMKITIVAKGIPGSSYGILHLYDQKDCANEIAISLPPTVSVDEELAQNLVVYPNPTQESFFIRNDEIVESLEIYNSIGQLLLKENHITSQAHSIDHLQSGSHVLILRNEENEIIRSIRLSKE